MKKNTNVNIDEDYDFNNDSFTDEGIDIPLEIEELEGAMDYYDDLMDIKKELR